MFNSEGEEVTLQRQPRLHDGKQLERLLRTVTELEKNKVRINWPSLRMLGYGDKAISDYFTLSSTEQYPDQRVPRNKRKRKIDQVVLLSNNEVKHCFGSEIR